MEKTGRNDPCPCGSLKKFKSCCLLKQKAPRKIKATWISAPKKEEPEFFEGPDLMERTFGDAIRKATDASEASSVKKSDSE